MYLKDAVSAFKTCASAHLTNIYQFLDKTDYHFLILQDNISKQRVGNFCNDSRFVVFTRNDATRRAERGEKIYLSRTVRYASVKNRLARTYANTVSLKKAYTSTTSVPSPGETVYRDSFFLVKIQRIEKLVYFLRIYVGQTARNLGKSCVTRRTRLSPRIRNH